jgi:carboxyl-terminal processing protease
LRSAAGGAILAFANAIPGTFSMKNDAPLRQAAARLASRAVPAALALLCAVPAAAQQPRQTDSPLELGVAERIHGLSLLWQEVNYNFAFFDQVPGLDWDSVYLAFIPRVLEAPTTWDYYRELQRMVALLHDGHTGVWMPQALQAESQRRDTYPWVLTHRVEDRVIVRGVGRSLEARIPLHSEIVEIDGGPATVVAYERHLPFIAQSTDHYRRDIAVRQALHGRAGEPVSIRYATPSGEQYSATLQRDRRTRDDEWVPDVNTPVPPFGMRWLDDGIAYVELNTFGDTTPAHAFEQALPELRRARGLVIDIRRNGGGSSNVGYRVASWITNDTLETSRWRTREHRAAQKAWGSFGAERHRAYGEMDAWYDGGSHGRVAPADGERVIVPTIVLQDHDTFSAAEDFLVAVDAIPHVTTLGRPTGGSTGQPLMLELPGGGGARIVTKRDTFPDGRDFVGIGIFPDVHVEPTVAGLRAGDDVQLAAALQRLSGS